MSFLSPIWLLGLLPWAAVVAVLLWSQRTQVEVPFVELWQGPMPPPARQRRRPVRLPPVFVVLALLATLLALMAAARPALRVANHASMLTILLDRGVTMSADPARWRDTIDRAANEIPTHVQGPVELVVVPTGELISTDRASWAALARDLQPTALQTREAITAAVQRHLARHPDPLVVISDQMLPINDARILQVAPTEPLENVGIVHVAARAAPRAQVMVRIRNQSQRQVAVLSVNAIRQEVRLPANGEEQNHFVDLPEALDLIEIQLDVPDDDDVLADNRAWLVRQRSWPTIEARTPLPPQLERMVETYGKQRPGISSSRVVIASTEQELRNEAGILLVPDPSPISGTPTVVTHAITANVTFPAVPNPDDGGTATQPSLPSGWTPIVSSNGHVHVAVREQPARQVSVNLDAGELSRSPQYVIFWTNVFDWAGEGDEQYAASPVRAVGAEWKPVEPGMLPLWPGVYRRSDGALLAMNALDVSLPPLPESDGAANRAALVASGEGARPLTPWFVLAALACLALAAATWPRARVSSRPRAVYDAARSATTPSTTR